MAQNTDVLLSEVRYTRADFTALRAYLNKLPVTKIAQLYYSDDDLETLGCHSDSGLQSRLEAMRERLAQRAELINPHLSELLRNARRAGAWSAKLIDFLVHAADQDLSTARRQDALSAWFKPRLAAVFGTDAIKTLADLISLIEVRGSGWWKPIPLIGPGKAQRIESWLEKHASTLGPIHKDTFLVVDGEVVQICPEHPVMVPLERIALPTAYNGSVGLNRNPRFCLISAKNDWEAIDCYLYKYRHQEKTRRAYQKELERFLLWCVYERRLPLSSVLLDDCEAYKDFLSNVPVAWIGRRSPRSTQNWRPFAGQLSAASQKYATQAILFFFNWLVNVRYLLGNPWATVAAPAVATKINILGIEKALPEALWVQLAGEAGILEGLCNASDCDLRKRYHLRGSASKLSMTAQFRLVRAALLLMGDGGIRRIELAQATRDKLKPVAGTNVWEMEILGKRNKWRLVYLPDRTVQAIKAHWHDRGLDFDFGMAALPLVSPLTAPETRRAIEKHRDAKGRLTDRGYSADGIYKIVKAGLKRIAEDPALNLEDWARAHLLSAAPHSFRHTFGTQTVAGDVPLDVVQKLLGHASLQTTTIYVQAEKKRSIFEMGKYFRKS